MRIIKTAARLGLSVLSAATVIVVIIPPAVVVTIGLVCCFAIAVADDILAE